MRHILLVLLASAPAFFAASPPRAEAAKPLAAAMHALDDASARGSADEMLAARAAFAALVADAPGSARNQYGLALADWRVIPVLGKARDEQARKLCKEGIAACDLAFATESKLADALALKAGLQGLALGFAPGAGMTLGPEIIEGNARARGMAPENPRVALLAAISLMHQPAFTGGGPKPARAAFEGAIALFEKAGDSDSTEIAWGRADAYLWSGRCLAALGDWPAARERYRQVLALRPDHAWTKHSLLPEAEKHLPAGAAR